MTAGVAAVARRGVAVVAFLSGIECAASAASPADRNAKVHAKRYPGEYGHSAVEVIAVAAHRRAERIRRASERRLAAIEAGQLKHSRRDVDAASELPEIDAAAELLAAQERSGLSEHHARIDIGEKVAVIMEQPRPARVDTWHHRGRVAARSRRAGLAARAHRSVVARCAVGRRNAHRRIAAAGEALLHLTTAIAAVAIDGISVEALAALQDGRRSPHE
jgi:hypothetical protein